jgi:hypothetical protein
MSVKWDIDSKFSCDGHGLGVGSACFVVVALGLFSTT